MIKNTSGQHLSFIAIATADGAAVTSGTPVVHLSKDGAAQATSSNTASHLGNGIWVLDLTQAETNADHLSAVMVLTNAVNSFAQAFPVVQADFKADVSALALRRLFEFPSTSATANSVSSVATVSPLIISAKKIYIHLRYSSIVDNTPDANTHREIALQPPTPVNTSTAPAEINLKTYFGSDNRYSISNEISSAEIDITSLGLEVLHGDWTIIVRDNQGMGYNQQVHGASIEFLPLPATIGDATAASQTSISSAISSLNDFDPSTDSVANVTTVGSVTSAVTTSNASDVTAIKAVTDNLPDSGALTSLATAASVSALNDFDPTTQTVTTDAASRAASQADVSSLATAASISSLNDFDPASDAVANVTTVSSVTNAVTTSNAADVTAIKSVTDKIDTALVQDGSVYQYTTNALENAPSGGGGGLTQADVRAAVGLASANLDTQLSTIDTVVDAVLVDTGTDIPASISALNDFDPTTQDVTTDAASRTASQADVSLLATAASIAALNDFDASTDMVIVSTNNDKSGYSLSTAPPTASEIYQEFTSGANEDAFKATGFATVNPDNASIAAIKSKTDSLNFTIANQVDANAINIETGGGIFSLTVTCEDSSGNAVANVRVNIDGTTTTLVTNSSGQVVFNLDAGTYSLVASPPSEFNTPADTSVTVSADGSQTITLTQASTSGSAGWVG